MTARSWVPAAAGFCGDLEQLSAATEYYVAVSVLLHNCAVGGGSSKASRLALGEGGDHRVEDGGASRSPKAFVFTAARESGSLGAVVSRYGNVANGELSVVDSAPGGSTWSGLTQREQWWWVRRVAAPPARRRSFLLARKGGEVPRTAAALSTPPRLACGRARGALGWSRALGRVAAPQL